MRRCVAFVALTAAVLWLSWSAQKMSGPVNLASAISNPVVPPGFGMKVAGGWLCDFYENDAFVFKTLLAFGANGEVVGSCSPIPNELFVTTGIGSWKPTGRTTFSMTSVVFERLYDMTNVVTLKIVADGVLTVCGNNMEVVGDMYVYDPTADPLDPMVEPWAMVPIRFDAKRITVE